MRLALTGATGFVGQYVLREALARGHTVTALARTPPEYAHARLSWLKGSLGERDADLVADCDGLVHIAGLIKARSRDAFMAINRDATANLLRETDSHTVLLSSLAAREPDLSAYAASKRAGEDAASLTTAIVRAPAVFGPGDVATRPFFTLMDTGKLPIPGGANWKSRRLSFVFVDDLARHILDQSEARASGITQPATLASATWLEFKTLAEAALGKSIRAYPIPQAALLPVAAATTLTSRLAGLGHLTLEKLREFQHPDWSVEDTLPNATPMVEALKTTFASYR